MFHKVTGDMNFARNEEEISKYWEEHDIFKKSVDEREGCPTYMFYDGPPTANGKPHIGHVFTRAIKDMIPRYRTMKGYQVPRKAGWDTHGLPVELEVEKKLGLNGKEQIEEYGVEPFIENCKESVWQYKGMWEDFSRKVAFWADMDDPYVTYHNDYIESEWWALKQIYDKGLLYKGFKVVPYCPRCGTPLASHEVAQGYKNVKERSAIAKFAVKGEDDTYFLAWTTTPWTLPSNVALCVNPDETYVLVQSANGERYILAEALTSILKEDYTVLERYTGKDLEYREYEPLFPYAKIPENEKAFYVVCDTYVTLTEGTGVVHIAPAFGEDDANVGRKYGLPLVQLVNTRGEMCGGTPWDGLFVKKADPEILKTLQEEGLLFDAPEFEHSYPFCWRCDTPLIYYARESWFIRMTDVKDEMIANNETINWIPESIGTGRFGDWLKNLQDWGISRSRYWGTPLNIWECECGHREVIGSIAELKAKSPDCPDDIELHRPYIDAVHVTCPVCGKPMTRVPDVIDCWFDSGSMPFAQYHYPFENQEYFESHFPADFISEAVDQTRGWFYSLLAVSTLLFGKSSYKNVIVMGLVQDEDGQKMSKSKGNAVDPMDSLEKHGADAVRWYFYISSSPWLPSRYSDRAVSEGQRKFLGTLWNTYAFFVLYANIDGFDPTGRTIEYETLSVMDKWLLSRLNSLITTCDDDLDSYKVTEAARALQDFVDEMSNWYVRRCRSRFWAKGMEQDKINAYMTLYTALVTTVKLAAPMIPFMTEEIYLNLVYSIDHTAPESVHLCDYPKADAVLVDHKLESEMDEVLEIVALGRAARNSAAIKNRQPLSEMTVQAPSEADLPPYLTEIVAEELNIKKVTFASDVRAFTTYSFKPQMRVLGPRYGKLLGKIREALADLDGNSAMDTLNRTGLLSLDIDGTKAELTKDDLLIEEGEVPGTVKESDGPYTVVLNTVLTPDLIEEGFVREIISKVQTMRKEAGFEVTDHITLYYDGNDRIAGILEKFRDVIAKDVLADSIEKGCGGYTKDWELNGEAATLGVAKESRKE